MSPQVPKRAPITHLALASALSLVACGTTPRTQALTQLGRPTRRIPLQFDLAFHPGLETLNVALYVTRPQPHYLVATAVRATRFLRDIQAFDADGLSIPLNADIETGMIALPTDRVLERIEWRVDLKQASRASEPDLDVARTATSLIASPNLWFWYPDNTPQRTTGVARVAVPQGFSFSAPWAKSSDGYLLDETVFKFPAYVAVGRFDQHQVVVPGGYLDLAHIIDRPELTALGVTQWLQSASLAASMVTGAFPVPRAQVVIAPADDQRAPLAFGVVGRGGGASVLIKLGSHASDARLTDDWVATHEFVHLSMPYIDRRDAWLSEGLATYYQEVLRARAGLITPAAAWDALESGFRKASARGTGRSLTRETMDMHQTRAYERVYWAGAALALLADAKLRGSTNQPLSLDMALGGLAQDRQLRSRPWTATELLAAMQSATHSDVMTKLAQQYLPSARFPGVKPLLRWLGVQRSGQTIRFVANAPGAHVRDQIMAPPRALSRELAQLTHDLRP